MNLRDKKSGFTLIEVLIAMSVLAVSTLCLSQLQIPAFRRVYASRADVERVPWLKKIVYGYFLKLPEKIDKPSIQNIQLPAMKVTTNVVGIDSAKSSLKQFAHTLKIVKTEATWDQAGKTKTQSMMAIVLPAVEERYEA